MAAREPAPLDGNVLAGPLLFLTTADATTTVMRCATCGLTDVMARTRVYATAIGIVARCAGCDAVLVVVVELPEGSRVAMPGAAWVASGLNSSSP
jgi:hypothetical protein